MDEEKEKTVEMDFSKFNEALWMSLIFALAGGSLENLPAESDESETS